MAKRIKMYNPKTGKVKNGFIGFDWETLLLAWIPMFVRGDIKSGIILLVIQLIFLSIQLDGARSFYWLFIFIQIGVSIIYNAYYTSKLVKKGFVFNDTDELNKAGAKAVGMQLESCVFTQSKLINITNNSGGLRKKSVDKDYHLTENESVAEYIDSSMVCLDIEKRREKKILSSDISKYGSAFFLTIAIIVGCGKYSFMPDSLMNIGIGALNTVARWFNAPEILKQEEQISIFPDLISTLFSFIYIMVMTIRSKSEIIFCTKNKSVSYYVSEWILLIMTVLVTAMAWSVFISSKQDVFFNITGTHLMLGAIAFSFVGIRSLAGFIWIALICVGISHAMDVEKAMKIYGTIFAICSVMGLSLQLIRLYSDQFGEMIKSDFMGARTIISGDVAAATKNTKNITKEVANIGMTYAKPVAQRIVNAKIIKRKVKAYSKKSGVEFISQVSRDKNKRTISRRNQNI